MTADRVMRSEFVQHVPAGGAVVHVDIPRDITGGLYLLATAFAPPGGENPGLPRRAVGLTWLAADPSQHRLDVKFDLPEKIQPDRVFSLPVTVTGAGDEPVFVTVAAVDERLLAIGNFPSPDPLDFFFGKRALGVALHDLYGRIIDASGRPAGPAAAITASGQAPSPATDPPQNIGRIVSLYSGVIALDKSGKAVVPAQYSGLRRQHANYGGRLVAQPSRPFRYIRHGPPSDHRRTAAAAFSGGR